MNKQGVHKKIKPLKVKPIPVPAGYLHPKPKYAQLPTHEFTMGLIAPKGAGKTTVICNLLQFYKGYFHTILVFSPTIESDEKWDYIKKQKLLIKNLPLKKWLQDQAAKKAGDEIVEAPPISAELENKITNSDEDFDGTIPEEHYFNDYDDETFQGIMEEQLSMIKALKKHGQPKYLANRILVIFDDLVGSALFRGARGSYFKGVNTRHRHFSASFLMVSQGYKEIPKTIRTNWTALIVFEIGNEREVFVIYEEYACCLKQKDWQESYRHAVDGDHDFLFINFQQPKKYRMMKNFEQFLIHDEVDKTIPERKRIREDSDSEDEDVVPIK